MWRLSKTDSYLLWADVWGHLKASDSPLIDTLSPVPPGDWYMPRSTKVVKEDLPEAFTKPLDWYWWSGRSAVCYGEVDRNLILNKNLENKLIWHVTNTHITGTEKTNGAYCTFQGWKDDRHSRHKNNPGIEAWYT